MLERLVANLAVGSCRYDTLKGRKHLVVPTAILAEGVWDGSNGPIYYPADELVRSVPAWNHKPIVVYHPEKNGRKCLASDPVILNTRQIGITLNAAYDDKLRCDSWIDVEYAKAVDKRVLELLEAGKAVEGSSGVVVDEMLPEGTWKDKKYKTTARNHRPDHLAILPDKIGAFSVADGGGFLQLNQAREPERNQLVFRRGLESALKAMGGVILDNELSFNQISRQLSDLLSSKYGDPGKYWDGYVCEVYPGYVIFCAADGKTYMQDYSLADDVVSLTGEAVQVKKSVEYVTVNGTSFQATENGLQPRETPMAFDKKAHVAGLIGNGFVEADRAWLEALPEAQLEKIKPVTGVQNAGAAAPAPGNPPSPAPPAAPARPQTVEQFIATAPPEMQGVFNDMLQSSLQERTRLVTEILAYPQNSFSKEELMAAPITNVRAIHRMIPQQPQYGLPPQQRPLTGAGAAPAGTYIGAGGAAPVVGNEAVPQTLLATPEYTFQPVIPRK